MKITNKTLWLTLILLALSAVLVLGLISCTQEGNPNESDVTSVEAESNDEAKNAIAELLKGKMSEYQIVRPETMVDSELKVILSFVDVLGQNGVKGVKPVSDYEKLAPVKDNEIIIGETTRKGKVYSEGEGVIKTTDEYTIQIVGTRLVLTYTDQKGLMDGVEYIMLSVIDGDETALVDSYDLELFERGIKRYSASGFSIKNHLEQGSKLSADADILFLGNAEAESKITIQLAKGFNVLSSFEATANADGIWQTNVTPNTDADSVIVRINGKVAERYEKVSFVKSKVDAASEGSKVYINGKQVDVHSNIAGNYAIASLEKGQTSMEVKIVRTSTARNTVVRPLSAGIEPNINGKEVTFTVTQFPCKLSVEFDDFYDDTKESVQLFLYEYEEFTPDIKDRELIYFAPGEYWIDAHMTLKSNTTVHVAEGAVVHARFNVKNADNVVIEGRGIFDTYYFSKETNQEVKDPNETKMMVFENCNNLTLKDYMLTGPRSWMTVLVNSDKILIDAVNISGTKMNSDGIDIVGSTNVTIQKCFLKTNDDSVVVKSWANDVDNVLVKDCVIWNLKYGNALEIGYETRCENIKNIVFENNDIIHIDGGACMSIHLGDGAAVSKVTYTNIRIEEASGKLIEFFIKHTQYSLDEGEPAARGHISDITLNGIEILGDTMGRISFEGFDANHVIKNVNIGAIIYNGNVVSYDRMSVTKNSFVSNITYNGRAI